MPTSDSTIEDVDDSISQLLLRENKHFRELREYVRPLLLELVQLL